MINRELNRQDLNALVLSGAMQFVDVFCEKYGVELVDMLPNTETSPPKGFIYVFDDNLGGYSMRAMSRSPFEDWEGIRHDN